MIIRSTTLTRYALQSVIQRVRHKRGILFKICFRSVVPVITTSVDAVSRL